MKTVDDLITPNQYSRPGTPLVRVIALVFHWVANPGTSAKFNRDWFESAPSRQAYGSTHYLIDLDGTVLRAIPEEEVAYSVGSSKIDPASGKIYTDWARAKFDMWALNPEASSPNSVTLNVELCHTDWDGHFTDSTLAAAQELAADICRRHSLDPIADITTHHGIVGYKNCPKLWTDHTDLFDVFKHGVKSAIGGVS